MGEGISAGSLHQKQRAKDHHLPLITVIVPVYNVAKVLERCVHSVLDQTYPHLEIILVDDGSTDMSGKFCDVLAKQHSQIKVIHQPNAGLSAARNAALEIATGEYVTFVDSDDKIHPELVRSLYDLAQSTSTAIAIGSFREVYPDGRAQDFATASASVSSPASTSASNSSSASAPVSDTIVYSTIDCLIAMLLEAGFTMSACAKLYRRQLFDNVRFPVGELYEDVGTTYRLILQCPEIAYTKSAYYDYYQNASSIIHQTFRRQKLDLITLTDEMCDQIWQHFDQLSSTSASPSSALSSHSASSLPTSPLPPSSPAAPSPSQRQQLRLVLAKRRMHARFSVLRQMVIVSPAANSPESTGFTPAQFKRTRRTIARYLRRHRADILHNPYSSRRDRLAMRALLLGLPAFRFAWKYYAKRHK